MGGAVVSLPRHACEGVSQAVRIKKKAPIADHATPETGFGLAPQRADRGVGAAGGNEAGGGSSHSQASSSEPSSTAP